MDAGGSIGSLLYEGRELIDSTDLGRYIQLSFYDGNDVYGDWNDPTDTYGWNPEQAGDKDLFGAKVLEYRTADKSTYIRALGKEWGRTDEDSDVTFETWAWQRAGYFEVHLRGTHTGSDTHAVAEQEFPAAYFATSLTHEFSYLGDAPFTGAAIDELNLGGTVLCPASVPTESWAAFGTADRSGLILAVPPQPYLTRNWSVCLLTHVDPAVGYITPVASFDIPPGAVREETIYLIPGPIERGRAIVYDLTPHTNWTFDLDSAEGWRNSSGDVSVKDGVLSTNLGPDSLMTSFANLRIPGLLSSVAMRAGTKGASSELCLHFITAADPNWDTTKVACSPIVPGEFQTLTFDLNANPAWADGVVTQLGLSTSNATAIEIDSAVVNTNGYAWGFDIDGETADWTISNQLKGLEVAGGVMLIQSTGNDPSLESPVISADAATLPTIEIRMKVSAAGSAQLFFSTDTSPDLDEPKSLMFSPIADGAFHDYTLDMSSVAQWQGKITHIRLDPTDQPASVEIDYVRIVGPRQ